MGTGHVADQRHQRRTIHYSGRVQGVGFRYCTRQIAGRFAVTGYVQNLDDRRVRLVVEGDPGEIDGFLAEIAEAMQGYIRGVESVTSDATGEFQRFGIES